MKKNESKKSRSLIGTLIGAVIALVLTVCLFNPQLLPLSSETKSTMAELEKTHFLIEGSGQITLAHILTLILAVCVLWVFYAVLRLILNWIGKKNGRTKTVTNLIGGAAKYLVVILGVVWGLSILGVNSTAVLAGVGILGLVLGFGAQSLIEDVITGLFIIFESKYSIGDIIVLDDFRGTVRDIGVRTTTIEDAGGNLKVVNNSDIRNFQNRSKKLSLAICEVDVAYDTDIPRLEALLAKALPEMFLEHSELYRAQPEYMGVENLAESGMTLRFTIPVKEVNIFRARRQFNRDIRVLFAENDVEIPFPQVDVHQK